MARLLACLLARGRGAACCHAERTVLHARYNLLEALPRLHLAKATLLHNVVKQLPAGHVLHHHENVSGRVDHLVQADDVGVAEAL